VLREIVFLLKAFADELKSVDFVETSHSNTGVCKFELSQNKKAEPCRLIPRKLTKKTRTFNWQFEQIH